MPRMAGRKVSAKSADVATVSVPATPMEVRADDSKKASPPRPTATATAENSTALPEVATVRSTAIPGSRPRASSSRKRLTMNSE
jgi:hypothetical protein